MMLPRFASLAAAALGLLAAAPARAQFSFGPRVGLAVSSFGTHAAPSPARTRPLAGYQVGVVAQWKSEAFAFRPGLQFAQKGGRYTTEETALLPDGSSFFTYRNRNTLRINYVELPVQLAYSPRWARGVQLVAGTYAALGVGGYLEKDPEPESVQGVQLYSSRAPVQFPLLFGSQPDVPWADWGFDAGLAYQAGPLLVQAQHSWGAYDQWPERYDGRYGRRYHRVATLTLTYLFGKRQAPQF